MSTRNAAFCVALFVIANAAAVAGEESATVPQPDPAALVREVRAAEAWIDKVDGLRLRIQGHWSTPAEEIERRKVKYKKQFPETALTVENFSDLRAEATDTLEIAFDQRRAYLRSDGLSGPGTFNVRIWDGTRAIDHEKYTKQELYALDTKASAFLDLMMAYLPWPRQAVHAFWWTDPQRRVDEDFLGPADTYEFVGREKFRGVECFVVETPMYWRRLHIGVADHRVYGQSNRVLRRSSNAGLAVLKEVAVANGHTWKDGAEYAQWLATLPAAQQKRLNQEYFRKLRPQSIPQTVNWFADWKEVAPGGWMPMTMGYDFFDTESDAKNPSLSGSRDMKVLEVTINPKLPDELFVVEMKEGVQVNDWGHEPPLFYTVKKDRTPQEWQAILDDAKRRQQEGDADTAARDKLVGKPAPAFPAGAKWLQSEPLDWAKLKGKVVILDFWAEWCAPCRNDFPTVAQLHKDRETSGFVVIGVHNPGSNVADIEKVLKEFEMGMPTCIDVAAPDGPPTWGTLSTAFASTQLPYAFVIDRDGKIAGHGSLGQVMGKAHELADKAK